MTAIDRLSHSQNRRDEVPNQQLARDLAAQHDADGIREIAENLHNKNRNIQSDCIKVLYEIGYLDPSLIAEYAEEFVRLLHSRNNRMAWGGMAALATVAHLRPQVVIAHLDEIVHALEHGSVIAADRGVEVLAGAGSKGDRYAREVLPCLMDHLATCRPKDVPQHAEKCLPAIHATNKSRFISVLRGRLDDLSGVGLARVNRVIRQAEAL